MYFRPASFAVGVVALSLVPNMVSADDPPKEPAKSSTNDPFGIGGMAQAASDMRQAGEAFERFGKSLGGIAGTIAEALATMSSEFDPFGYKTGFRTIGRQTEIIQEKDELIRELLEREVERLKIDNENLREQLQPRKRRQRRDKE